MLITNSITPVKRLKNYWNKLPSGYVAGSVLQRIAREFAGRLRVEGLSRQSLCLVDEEGRFSCRVTERVDAQFMMHIVAAQVTLDIPASQIPAVVLKINNRGWIRSNGLCCQAPRKLGEQWADLCAMVEQDTTLRTALTTLNFRCCELRGTENGWQVLIEPFGGSEVVNKLPSFRRYIRLGQEQSDSLVLALLSLKRILGRFNDETQKK